MNNEIVTHQNKKLLQGWLTDNILIKGKSYDEFFQQFLKRPQVVSSRQIISKIQSVDEKHFQLLKLNLNQDLHRLLNGPRPHPIRSLDLSLLKIKPPTVSVITSSFNVASLERLDLSSAQLNSKSLRKIALCPQLRNLKELILESLSEETYDAIDALVASQLLDSLQSLKFGTCNIETILKVLLRSNETVYMPIIEEDKYLLTISNPLLAIYILDAPN